MTQLNPIHGALLHALASDLPDSGSVVFVAMPGAGVEAMIQQAKPGLALIRTVSAAMLAALPALCTSLAANAAILPVAPRAFEQFDAGPQGLAAANRAPIRFQAFSDLLASLNRMRLSYFGAAPGQADLLLSALPVLARKGVIAWLDLDAEAAAQGAALLAAAKDLDVEIFGITPAGRIIAPSATQSLTSLILLPRRAWNGDGLRRLAQNELGLAPGDLPSHLIIPASRCGSAAVLAKLAGLSRPHPAPEPRRHTTLTPADGLLCGANGRLKDGVILFSGKRLELILPAPSQGAFRLQIIPGATPKAPATIALAARHADSVLDFVWSEAQAAFESTGTLAVTDPQQPIRLPLSRAEDGGVLQISALALHLVRAPQDAHPAP